MTQRLEFDVWPEPMRLAVAAVLVLVGIAAFGEVWPVSVALWVGALVVLFWRDDLILDGSSRRYVRRFGLSQASGPFTDIRALRVDTVIEQGRLRATRYHIAWLEWEVGSSRQKEVVRESDFDRAAKGIAEIADLVDVPVWESETVRLLRSAKEDVRYGARVP